MGEADDSAGGAVWMDEWLASLSHRDLDDYAEHRKAAFEEARQAPGHGLQAWWRSKLLSGARAEQRRRGRRVIE